MNQKMNGEKQRRMRKSSMVGVIAGALLGISALPAAAAPQPGEAQMYTMHRGKSGCFTWSYDDSGWNSSTVYYHNTCKTRHWIQIGFTRQISDAYFPVKAGEKGHRKGDGDVKYVWDAPAPS